MLLLKQQRNILLIAVFLGFFCFSGISVFSGLASASIAFKRDQCYFTPHKIGIDPAWGKFIHTGVGLNQVDACVNQGFLRFSTTPGANRLPLGRNVYRSWYAPPGVVFRGAELQVLPETMEGGWQIQMIQIRGEQERVVYSQRLAYGRVENLKTYEESDFFTGFRLRLICRWEAGCVRQPVSSIRLYNISFHLLDRVAPRVSIFPETGRPSSIWLKGKTNEKITVDVSDPESGLWLTYLGTTEENFNLGIDILLPRCQLYSSLFQYCPAEVSSVFPIDSSSFPSGRNTLYACAKDASSNTGCRSIDRLIDNSPPEISLFQAPPLEKTGSVFQASIANVTDAHSGVGGVVYNAGINEQQTKNQIIQDPKSQKCLILNTRKLSCQINTSEYPSGSRLFVYAYAFDKVGNFLGGPSDPNQGVWLTPNEGTLIDHSTTPAVSFTQPMKRNYFQNQKIVIQTDVRINQSDDNPTRLDYRCLLNKRIIACSRRFVLENLKTGEYNLEIRVEDLNSGARSLPLETSFNVVQACYPRIRAKRIRVLKTKQKNNLAVLAFFPKGMPLNQNKISLAARIQKTNRLVLKPRIIRAKKLKNTRVLQIRIRAKAKRIQILKRLIQRKSLSWNVFSQRKCLLPK